MYTILIRDGTYAEILTITGSVSATRTVTLVGLSKEAILAPGLSAAQNVINTGTYTTINCINIKILPTGSSTGAIASIGSGVTTSFERCLIEPLAAMKLANGGSSTANFYRCTLGQAGRTYTNGMAATGGVSSNLNLYYCDILGTAANSKGLVASETYPNTRLYYCKITNGGGALSYDLLQSGGATVTVGRCLYNRTKTSGTITVLDGDIPALTSTDLRAILFYDTEANILAATKDAGTLAVSNDTYYLFQSLGAGTWRKSAFRFQPEGANPDMGLLPPLTDKSRIGYGETYITDKTISNSAIGNNANSTEGSIKEVAADGFYGYISGTYAKFVTDFRFRELNQTYYLEHQPISGGDWIIVESGNSERLGLNGLPSVQGYHVSMGAYPPKLVISGGTF